MTFYFISTYFILFWLHRIKIRQETKMGKYLSLSNIFSEKNKNKNAGTKFKLNILFYFSCAICKYCTICQQLLLQYKLMI